MATIDRIDEQNQKKRRIAGPYGGALAGAVGALAAAPGRAYNALAAGYSRGAPPAAPLAALPDPSSVLAAQQPRTIATQPAPLAPKPQSVDAATMTPAIAQPAQPVPQANVVPSATVAALDPQTARALSAAKTANTDEYGDAPGYRGPLAPQRGIAGDFDFATNAARDFAARSSDPRERAKVPGLVASITQRDAAARGDVDIANANATTDTNARSLLSAAQGTEAKARANSLTELLPSEKALKGSQTAENLGRTARDLAVTSNTLAMQPGAVQAQSTAAQIGQLDLKSRQRHDELAGKIATETDPKKREQYAAQYLALLGKGKGYKALHAAGAKTLDGTAGDNIVIINEDTGKAEVVPIGGSQAAPPGMKQVGTSGGKPVYEDASGKRFTGN